MDYIEDITRWREDTNFMFEWQEQYLTSERSEQQQQQFYLPHKLTYTQINYANR